MKNSASAAPLLLAAGIAMAAPEAQLGEVTVTGTREGRPLAQTPAAVGAVKGETLRLDKPSHPAQVMGQIPGVAVAVTNGEGHTTAIRQPFTTAPVYLFLEDGIPSRSTGFFNHNALYEINLPQAGGIEVMRGPGTALYGSDAIAGVVNVLTRTPPGQGEFYVSGEAGEHGWRRALVGGGNTFGADAWRADLNYTTTDGWRDETAYDRKSGTLRWDRSIGEAALLKTVVAFSSIDQETGANSPLVRSDYENNPTRNYLPIAFRKVDALRISTSYERENADSLLSLAPYFRDDSMDLLASFRLRFDPTVASTENKSYGLMAKWRKDFAPMKARLIAGVDFDYSPGGREENRINPTTRGSGATQEFIAYSVGPRIYDYDVSFRGISPYLHGEISPTDRLRITAGVRYDDLSYDFDNNIPAPVSITLPGAPARTVVYGQSADTKVNFDHLSPKLGATFALGKNTHLFAAYNHGFRAPSEGDLFRPSSATNQSANQARLAAQANAASSLSLKPIKSDQVELGLRGAAGVVSYDAVVYNLEKRDDIVSVRDPVTTFTQTTNAGKTRHRGVELGLGIALAAHWRIDAAWSYAKHTYEEWTAAVGNVNVDFSGKEIESAPRVMANTRLSWSPAAGTRATLEWVRLGSYWLDQANTAKYEGHDIFHLRGNWQLMPRLALFGSVHNVTDERYADSAQLSTGATPAFSPGLPRTFYAGLEARW